MIRFLDLEASSLLPGSFPIEVAWVDEDGRGESHLIRPPDVWLRADRGMPGWDSRSALIHCIALEQLMDEGEPVEQVASRAAEALVGPDVIAASDALGFDEGWLNTLFEAAGLLDRADLTDVQEVYVRSCEPLRGLLPTELGLRRDRASNDLRRTVRSILAEAEEAEARRARVRHRALPDAEGMWRTWCLIGDEVHRRLTQAGRR